MKQPLLLALAGAFAFIVFSSSKDGPFHGDNENRTGAGVGSTASCDGTNCHPANATSTIPTITITEGSSTTPSATYTSGKTYTVRIGGTSTASGTTHFGFQLAAVRAANTTTSVGTFTAANSSTAVRTVSSSFSLVEHTTPIAGTGSGSSWTYATTATWVAPNFGSGPVKMYLTLNAVNNDNFTSGDRPNHIEVTFNENQVSVANTSFGADIKLYPNPATTFVNISEQNAANGNWDINVYNTYGQKMYTEQLNVTSSTLNHTLNTNTWAHGLYMLQLVKDSEQKTIPVVIQ